MAPYGMQYPIIVPTPFSMQDPPACKCQQVEEELKAYIEKEIKQYKEEQFKAEKRAWEAYGRERGFMR